jgi:hypothetical protein
MIKDPSSTQFDRNTDSIRQLNRDESDLVTKLDRKRIINHSNQLYESEVKSLTMSQRNSMDQDAFSDHRRSRNQLAVDPLILTKQDFHALTQIS